MCMPCVCLVVSTVCICVVTSVVDAVHVCVIASIVDAICVCMAMLHIMGAICAPFASVWLHPSGMLFAPAWSCCAPWSVAVAVVDVHRFMVRVYMPHWWQHMCCCAGAGGVERERRRSCRASAVAGLDVSCVTSCSRFFFSHSCSRRVSFFFFDLVFVLGSGLWTAVMWCLLAAGSEGVMCGSRSVTQPSGFGYQPSMNTALISSQQFLSPTYLLSHHAHAGLFFFSWCINIMYVHRVGCLQTHCIDSLWESPWQFPS
jgi:hypothetical protein